MTDPQTTSPPPPSAKSTIDDEIDLFDYLLVIWRHRWMIFLLCLVAMALAVAVSLRKPRQYESTVTIVPPLDILQRESAGGLGSLNNPLLRQVIDTSSGSIANMYVEILNSREVADAVIERFGLMDVYEGVQYRADARRRLGGSTKVETTDGGAVKIAVVDRDPNLAAAIAGAYIEELDKQNKRLSASQATSMRIFLENQLKEVEGRLSKIDNILSREAKTQEMLYELFVQQYELAKIEEAKSMPTIQVLDPPVVPERGVARGTVRKGVMAGIAAFLLGIFLAFTREFVTQARRRRDRIDMAAREAQLPEAGMPPARKHTSPEMVPAVEHGVGTG